MTDVASITRETELFYIDDNSPREFYNSKEAAARSYEDGRESGWWSEWAALDSMTLAEFVEVYGEEEAVARIESMTDETAHDYLDPRPSSREVLSKALA